MAESVFRPGRFLTLTFDDRWLSDEHLDRDWWVAEFRRFRRRLRYQAGEKLPDLTVAERGEKLGRPHMHSLVFGVPERFPRKGMHEFDFWRYGNVFCGDANASSAGYVAGYVADTEKRHLRIHSGRSPRLGERYLRWYVDQVKKGPAVAGARFKSWPDPATGLLESACIEIDFRKYMVDRSWRQIMAEHGLVMPFSAVGENARVQASVIKPRDEGSSVFNVRYSENADIERSVRWMREAKATSKSERERIIWQGRVHEITIARNAETGK